MSPTNSCLACTLDRPEIEITAIATSILEYDAPKYAVKFGASEYGAIGYGALEYYILKFDALGFATLNFCALDSGTLEYGGRVDDVKDNAGHILPRFQEPNNETLDTKDKMIAAEDGTNIKARQSIEPNEEEVRARVNVRAEIRDNLRVQMRDDERVHTSTHPHDWDPGGGPVNPQDYRLGGDSDAGKSTTDDCPLSEVRQLPSWPIGSIRADSPSRRSELLA